jgi:hypothetical protein
MGLMRDVTAENFESMAKLFSNTNDGICAVICLEPWVQNGFPKPATIGAWMAWRDYRLSKKMNVAFMDYRAEQFKTWTVPSLWPNEFDADRTVQDDMAINSRFNSNPFRKKIVGEKSAEDRANFAAKILKARPMTTIRETF